MNSRQNGNVDFRTFVKREQTAAAQAEPVDWTKEREDWLSHLSELYGRIESFLAEYIKADEIKVHYHDIDLNEENIGSYKAPKMIIKIGRQEITLTPVGTLLIGIKGRVDAVGPAGRTRFVLADSTANGPLRKVLVGMSKPEQQAAPKRVKWRWKIATRPPAIQYLELTQESLFEALMEIANG